MDSNEARNFIESNRHGWQTFNSTELGLLNNEDRLIRALPDIREHEFYGVADFLKKYADPKNEAHSAIVTDPKVDGQEVAGTWRHVSTHMVRVDSSGAENASGKHFRAVQELRRGFLTTLSYDEARLIEDRITPGDAGVNNINKRFQLQWNAVDPDLADSLVAGAATNDAMTDVKHRRAIVTEQEDANVTLDVTGITIYQQAVRHKPAEDGTATVEMMIGDTQFILSGFTSWLGSSQTATTDYYNVPAPLAQGILTAAQARGADAFPTGYNDSEGLVNIRVKELDTTGIALNDVPIEENCDAITTASFLWGTGDSSLLPVPGTVPQGTTYRRQLSERGDGTFNITLIKVVRQYRDITEYDGDENSAQLTEVKEWKGVTTQDLSTELVTDVAGKRVRVNKVFRDDCSIDIQRNTTTPKAQGVTHSSESRADQTGSRVVAKNAAVKVDASGGGSGTIVRARSEENEFGLFDNETVTTTAVDQTSNDAETRSDRTVATEKHTQADAEASAARGVGETNKVIRVRNQETEFGKYRTEREVITPVDQSTTSGEDRHDQSSTVTEHTQADAAVTAPPTAADGTIARVQNRETEFGKFATREETITAKAQTTTHSSESRADRTASRVVAQNAAAKADASGGGSGTIVNARSKENEFGLFDNEVETLTAVNQTWTEGETRSDRTSETTVNSHADAEADPTRGIGETNNVIRVRNREDEYGKFYTEREVVTSVDQTNTMKVDSPGRTVVETEHTHAASALGDPSASTGQTVQHTSRETEFGDYNTIVRTTTGVKVDTGWVTFDHPDGTVGVRSIINGTSSDVTTVKSTLTTRSTAGDNTTLSVSPGEDGLYNITASYRPQNGTIRLTSSVWGTLTERIYTFAAWTHPNGTAYRAFKVHLKRASTETAAYTHFTGTATTGYTKVSMYQGWRSDIRHVGQNRWESTWVEVSDT